ncbi:hypothetical protein [Citrobacter phage CVT22]|uniref:Uncharacterized protein n=1 Tax=Citrobacter phage CVT22 TaxID=1622234 RepID=A0A0R6AS73_9CAUD|nr:hypothetical protein APL39_gp39 [Citrobacter phage CVT22]AJT60743.1 hypothetical protein [Citrobacter phage CVT22]
MCDLKVGEVYKVTLNNDYYEDEKSIIKYIGKHPEWADIYQFEVMETKHWPYIDYEDCIWFYGETIDLGIEDYTFEPYNIVLENE